MSATLFGAVFRRRQAVEPRTTTRDEAPGLKAHVDVLERRDPGRPDPRPQGGDRHEQAPTGDHATMVGNADVHETGSNPYANPTLCCDIVMKGGITSGVVYPGAVLPLAERYRFKCIGGASAGGIAAAMVAAAEHARGQGGFSKLAELPGELAGTTPDGDPLMLQLFQADAPTRPLFSVLISYLKHGPLGLFRALRSFPRFPLITFAMVVISVLLSATAGADPAFAVAGVFAAVVTLLVGFAADVIRAVGRLPDNDFGLCRLGPETGTEQRPALTGWLHQRIQATAGRTAADAPLTFSDLWAGPGVELPPLDQPTKRLDKLQEFSRDDSARAVDLQMMTTDLTHGRPLRLPVPYQPHDHILEDDGGALFFDECELRRFFPGDVVDHLVRHALPASDGTAGHLQRLRVGHLKHFPIGPDLPVVVATRMTLSFPVLISAIPLYTLNFHHQPDPTLVRVLFSDGGIASNFPVHFFDSPLPRRPTFALNLIGFEPGEKPDPAKPELAVRAPGAVNERAYQHVAQIESLGGFFTAIKDAMQNWRDNAQAQLPGFRDRVVHLKLDKGEGGLNLNMKPDKITELNDRGRCAGEALVGLFANQGATKPEHWNDHRFVRYRVTMSLLERFLRSYDRGYGWPADSATTPYPERVAQGTATPYALPNGSADFALEVTGSYLGLVEGWVAEGETLDDRGVPRPPSTLRAVPPV
jgi:hypothetical protein